MTHVIDTIVVSIMSRDTIRCAINTHVADLTSNQGPTGRGKGRLGNKNVAGVIS